jgi:hypothetical protein
MFLCSNYTINHVKRFNVLFLFMLLVVPCISAAGINGSLDAGGFAGESFKWDYSFYVKGIVSASTNDSAHITWAGLNATITYPSSGDRYVRFTFRSSGGTDYSGTGRIRIVEKEEWIEKPRIDWAPRLAKNDYANGEPDYEKIMQSAEALNVNGISLVSCTDANLKEITGFLTNTSLKIWPILRPPGYSTVASCLFKADYEAWSELLANLSLDHPNLQAYLIDDFHPAGYPSIITPAYIRRITQAKDRINPNLRFTPVMYFDSGNELDYFSPGNPYKAALKDGATMWYYSSIYKRADISVLNSYVQEAHESMRPSSLTIGVYPIAYKKQGEEMFYAESFVESLVTSASEGSDGVHVFSVPLGLYDYGNFENATIFKQPTSNDPDYSFRLGLPSGYANVPGWYQEVTETISLPGSVSSANISFAIRDSRGINPNNTGYHFKQLLVNDCLLWDADALSDSAETLTVKKTITSCLTGNKANITIRLLDKEPVGNFGIDVYIGNITVYVNGAKKTNNWTFKSGIEPIYQVKFNETFYAIARSLGHLKPPLIAFSPPTPANNESIRGDKISIRSIASDDETPGSMSSFIDWNGSLIGWYRFNDETGETGSIFRDWSGSKNNGLCSGSACPAKVSGRFGSALLFDGVNDVVNISDPSEDLSGNLTIEFWIKPSNIGVARINPLDKAYWGEFAFTIETDGRLRYYHGQNKSNYTSFISLPAATIINNSWQHIVLTRDADAKVLRSYYNGVLKNTAAYAITPSRTSNAILIGDGYASPFKGSIDEVRIYNRVLSLSEIKASYNSGLYALDVDFSSLPLGGYSFLAYAQDADGNTAATEKRTFTLSAVTTTTTTSTTSTTSTVNTTTTTSTSSSSSTSSPTTTSSTSTTVPECVMPGNDPSCDEVALSEVVDAINQWWQGNMSLGEIIDLINSWADPAVYPPD